MRALRLTGLALVSLSAGPVLALSPAEVFEKVSPSVWAIRGLDAQERPFSYGSGVVIGSGRMVTNCHVLAKAKSIQVRRENVTYEAKLEHADVQRDLCTLTIAGFAAPAVQIAEMSSVKVGNRAYVVGNPERLALTLSEGLISGLRTEDPNLPPIQTSAAISPGSSGGGLFDEQARLVGITTLIYVGRQRIAQNLNFAAPAEWIREVPERAKEQLARRRENAPQAVNAAAAPSSGMPPIGALWKYSFRDQQYRTENVFTVRVTGVSGWLINESIGADGGEASFSTDAQQIRFAGKQIAGRPLVEFSPYLLIPNRGEAPASIGVPAEYPVGFTSEAFRMRVESVQQEEISVPAGSFKAVRVEVSGERSGAGPGGLGGGLWNTLAVARFRYTAWYAPEIGRYVRARHQQWNPSGALSSDELVQLLEYRPK